MRHLLAIDTRGGLQLVDIDQHVRMPIGEPMHERQRSVDRVQAAVWSSSGEWTAWSVASADAGKLGDLRLHDEETDTHEVLLEGVESFCLSPSPSGRHLAHLSPGPLGLELGVSDIVSGDLRIIERGQPLFWSWSPTSAELAVHVGNRVSIIGIDGSQPHPLTHEAGPFVAPSWLPGGSVVYAMEDAIVCRDIEGVTATLVAEGSAGRFLSDPDGRRLAYIDVGGGEPRLLILDLVTSEVSQVTDRPVGCFFWSVGGELATLAPVGSERVQWLIGAGPATVALDPFRPGRAWSQTVLPFFEQFASSNPCWSVDGRRLVAPAVDDDGKAGALVQEVAVPHASTWVSDVELGWWA